MTQALIVIACALMLPSILVLFSFSSQKEDQPSKSKTEPRQQSYLIVLVVAGTLMSFGGFWIDWMLWGGIVLIELGCLLFLLQRR